MVVDDALRPVYLSVWQSFISLPLWEPASPPLPLAFEVSTREKPGTWVSSHRAKFKVAHILHGSNSFRATICRSMNFNRSIARPPRTWPVSHPVFWDSTRSEERRV